MLAKPREDDDQFPPSPPTEITSPTLVTPRIEAHLHLTPILESLAIAWQEDLVGIRECMLRDDLTDEIRARAKEIEEILEHRIETARNRLLAVLQTEFDDPAAFDPYGPPEVVEMAKLAGRLRILLKPNDETSGLLHVLLR